MQPETYALALWALQEERGNVWLALSYNSEDTLQSLQAELARFDAAIADLEAEQAAPQPPYLYETGLTGATMPDEVFNTIAAALYNCPGILTHRSAAQEWLKQQRPQQ